MPYSNFSIGSCSQEVTVANEHIETGADRIRSYIRVFLNMTLRLNHGYRDSRYNFINITSNLSLLKNGEGIHLSETTQPLTLEVTDDEKKTGTWLNFYVDSAVVFAIQKHRDGGDVKFLIKFEISALCKEPPVQNKIELRLSTETLKGEVQFDVSKSHWVEKLFPKLGYPGFKLFEIPLRHHTLQEAYDNIISEFNLAESYFNQSDYNKCIGHCRSTLDAINRNLKKIKEGTESETAFKWLKQIDEASATWIDEVSKSLAAISSKAHHSGLKKDFTRKEAESIYLVTLGLMNFIGQASLDYKVKL